jgi:hypothetical protein
MISEDLEGIGPGISEALTRHLQGVTEENYGKSQDNRCPAEIRTETHRIWVKSDSDTPTRSVAPYALVKLYQLFSSVLEILTGYSETSVHLYHTTEGPIQEDDNILCEQVSVAVTIWNCIREVFCSNLG